MANRRFTQFFYTLHNKPTLLDCKFVVDSTNASGVGISGLSGAGIASVFMNSSASFVGDTHTNTTVDNIASTASLVVGMPVQGSGIAAGTTIASISSATAIKLSAATGSSVGSGTITYQAVGNPNPGAGVILVKLADNYNSHLGGFSGQVSYLSGSALTSVTANSTYTITALGTATTAQWVAKGVPVGVTPAVGLTFVASATGAIGGSGAVQLSYPSGITDIELIGTASASVNPGASAAVLGGASGAYLIFQCVAPGVIAQNGTTHTSTTVDGLTSTVGMRVGMAIMGTGIPLGATVASITSATAITISAAATASATVATSVLPAMVATAPVDKSKINLAMYLNNSAQGV